MAKTAAEWKAAGNAALGKQAYDDAIAAYTEVRRGATCRGT
jgi:hypothetical protein